MITFDKKFQKHSENCQNEGLTLANEVLYYSILWDGAFIRRPGGVL